MRANGTKTVNKHVFSKIYFDPSRIARVAKIITDEFSNYELSILGKTSILYSALNQDPLSVEVPIKKHTSSLTKVNMKYDYFYNPDIGYIFVTGPLTSIFLNDLEGKTLGAISVGPYSILRGLGIPQKKANAHIRALKKGGYLLILRTEDNAIDVFNNHLDT